MLSDFGALMHREIAAVRKHLLPAALIVIGVEPSGPWARGEEMRALSQSISIAPHEIHLARFVKKLDDVGPLVGDNSHSELLVLERYAPVPLVNELSDAAPVVAVVMVGLIAHMIKDSAQ